MTANAVNDPKIRYKLGEAGALDGMKKQLKLLVSEYHNHHLELTLLGFNGNILDLESVLVVKTHALSEDDEAVMK